MKKNILVIITVCVILTLSLIMTGCPAANSILSLNLETGSSYKMDIAVNLTIEQEMDGQKLNTDMDYTISYIIEGKDDDKDGNKQIDITISDMKMNVNMQELGVNVNFDTANAADDVIGKKFVVLAGSTFTLIIDKNGRVIRVKGVEDILNKINLTDDEIDYAVYGILEGIFTEESLKELFGSSTWVTTTEPIKPGYIWEETMVSTKYMPIESKSTYTLYDIKDNLAYISSESDIKFSEDYTSDEDIKFFGMSYSISGKQTGEMIVDTKTGLVMDGETNMEINGEISMDFDGTEIIIPMIINTTISIKTEEG